MQDLKTYKKHFDRELAAFFVQRLKVYQKLAVGTSIPPYIDHARTIALSGGKRVRPYIAQLSYETFGGKQDSAIREVGMGLELLHLFALAHDDVIDRGKTRHGVVTTQEYVQAVLRRAKRRGDLTHIAEGQAVLVGDLLFMWAEELVAGTGMPNPERVLARVAFREMVDEVIVGEMLDVDLSTHRSMSLQLIKQKHILKTARYSFVGPIRVGARLATGTAKHDAFARKFGEAVGLAFQIQDDVLDIMGGAGKTAQGDVRDGQHTYVTAFMLTQARPVYAREFKKYFGKSDIPAARVRQLCLDAGAIAYASSEASALFAESRRVLQKANLSAKSEREWLSLVDLIEHRAQ
ncbi:MAG: polyprenyl synthetase family protein [Candidatus Doudnabacteria bacterium]|nr:polyprenyl synthetase family protein [Candidatus Doudnabacteria bacterium]